MSIGSKTVFVTGVSNGIGFAIADAYLKARADGSFCKRLFEAVRAGEAGDQRVTVKRSRS
jgi:NAD(P)-dependent dehydrogenase (short-subunit alcohol dehydrogenase family)